MDKEISNVGTQYIICECGDNFPNEKFLNIHLANGHGEVETFQCDVCPEIFTSANSLNRHLYTHKTDQPETPKKPELKTYSRKVLPQEVKKEKKPPVIKLKNLTRIDSISLIENLKTFGKFIKIEPQVIAQPRPEPEPELPEPEPELPEPEPELPEPELELPEPESELPEPESELPEPEPEPEPEPIFMEVSEEEGQVIVKNEKQEAAENGMDEAEEIYYQCDVCNSIFYTEWDFNIHYQSAHALKLEPGTAEQILERHLVTDHADDAGVKAEADTAYYFECELGTEETDKSAPRSVIADGVTGDPLTDVKCDDGNTQIYPASSKEDKQELDEAQVKEVKKTGGAKKVKRGRLPKEDVCLQMPPGLSQLQKVALAKKRTIIIEQEQIRKNAESHRKRHPERRDETLANYKKKDPDCVVLINRMAVAKYAKNNPEAPKIAGKKYQEKKKWEKMKKEADKLKELKIMEEALDKMEINQELLNDDVNTQIHPVHPEEENIQELVDHDLLKVVKVVKLKETTKKGRPKKVKKGRPPIVDVYLDMPPGLSRSQMDALAKKRKTEIRKQQSRKARQKYQANKKLKAEANKLKYLELKEEAFNEIELNNEDLYEHDNALICSEDNVNMQGLDDPGLVEVVQVKKIIKRGRPPKQNVYSDIPPGLTVLQIEDLAKKRRIEIRKEQNRKSNKKYRKNNPGGSRRAAAKYTKNYPEVNRRSSRECQEREENTLEELKIKKEALDEVEINNEDLICDTNAQIYSTNYEEDNINMQELHDNGLLKVVEMKEAKNGNGPKKVKKCILIKEEVYSNMPPGLSNLEKAELANQRRIEIRKEQRRKSSKKYAQKHPEVSRRSSKKYQEKKRLEKQKMKEETMTACEKNHEYKELNIKEETFNEIKIEIEEILGF